MSEVSTRWTSRRSGFGATAKTKLAPKPWAVRIRAPKFPALLTPSTPMAKYPFIAAHLILSRSHPTLHNSLHRPGAESKQPLWSRSVL